MVNAKCMRKGFLKRILSRLGAPNVVAAGMLILFAAAGVRAETTDVFSGRDLLKMMREKDDHGQELAYENRGEVDHLALHEAADKGDIEKISTLIANRADINAADKGGFTPLHVAARAGNTDVVELLIAKGANVNAKDKHGATALYIAALRAHPAIAELLIANGAKLDIFTASAVGNIERVTAFLRSDPALVNAKGPGDFTPLYFAAASGQNAVTELLIIRGAVINAKNHVGSTPLHAAAGQNHSAIAELLIANGADVNAENDYKMTPLLNAAAKGYPGMAKLLIARGADINAKDKNDQAPLDLAEKADHKAVADLLRKATPSTNPAGGKLLEMVPAGSLFCARVNNFDYTLNQIDQFLAGVSPLPMGVSILARTQLAKMLGNPELNSVNMGGNFAIFATSASGESTETNPVQGIFIGAFVPVTDYKQFITANPNVGQPDENGVSKITSEGMPPMLAAQAGGYALISSANSYDKLVATAKSIADAQTDGLASALDADQAKEAIAQPIWAFGNVQLASRIFGPWLFDKIEQMKTMMAQFKQSGQTPMGPDPAAIMDMYAGVLETLMKETKSLSISVNPKPNVLNITKTITALPGTDMADMFTADASIKQENKLLGYLEDGAVVNASGRITGKLNAKAMDFLATIIGKDMSAEDKAKIKSLASDVATVFSGNDAMTFAIDLESKPPFVGKYVIEIKDEDKINKLIEESTELFNTGGIADFYKSLGMEISFTLNRGADSYKGVSIDSARLTMKSTDANSPQGLMINAMYGGGFEYRWATVDGLWACAIGGDIDSSIRRLIDQVKAGGPKQMAAEIKAALALLPQAENADFLVTYNYVRLLKIVPAMMAAMMPVPMPQPDIPTKSNIVLAGKIASGKMVVDIALPKQHLTEIMAAFQMMQQKMQTQQKTSSRIPESFAREKTWVKCRNQACEAEYEITKKEYFEYVEKHADLALLEVPPLVCKKCDQESVYRAVKCAKCGLVFETGTVPSDFEDRCPKCKYSKIEEGRRKKAREARLNE